jgi:hypothetical protein
MRSDSAQDDKARIDTAGSGLRRLEKPVPHPFTDAFQIPGKGGGKYFCKLKEQWSAIVLTLLLRTKPLLLQEDGAPGAPAQVGVRTFIVR